MTTDTADTASLWVLDVVEADVPFNPVDVRLLSALGQMLDPDHLTNLLPKLHGLSPRKHCRRKSALSSARQERAANTATIRLAPNSVQMYKSQSQAQQGDLWYSLLVRVRIQPGIDQ
jgi:hypothetical protein